MYRNKYNVEWKVKNRIQEDFSETEKDSMIAAQDDFNEYFQNASEETVFNRKYISRISFFYNIVRIEFETQKPIPNILRRGNALRQYSRFLAEEGFDLYVGDDHRLMRAI